MFGLVPAPAPHTTLSSRAAPTLPLRISAVLTPVLTDDCWQPLSGWQSVLAPPPTPLQAPVWLPVPALLSVPGSVLGSDRTPLRSNLRGTEAHFREGKDVLKPDRRWDRSYWAERPSPPHPTVSWRNCKGVSRLSSGCSGLEPGGFLRWGASGLSEMCLWCACPLRSSVNTRNTS